MIKTIYLSNILEGNYRSYQSLPSKKRIYWNRYDFMEANRALFYNNDHKAIITSYPINPQHFSNSLKIMNWKQVINLTPKQPSASICEDCLADKQLYLKLIELIKKNPGIGLIPYRATLEFYKLIFHLAKKGLNFTTPETVSQKQEFIVNYCHCKRGFRHLWSKALGGLNLNINIPQGFICGNKEEAIEAGWWFQQQNRSFIIKYNKGTQGIGLIFNYTNKLVKDKNKFIAHFRSILTDKIWHEPCIIVEELIKADKKRLGGSPSIEFYINQSGQVIPSYASEQLLADDKKTFMGVYIHPKLIKHQHIQTAFKAGKIFGQELSRLGYRGYYDVDLVISPENKIYAVESNLRRTGGTHIHEAACSLLGKNYLEKFHVIGEDVVLPEKLELDYQKCLNLLKGLEYHKQNQFGFIFCNPDMLAVNIANLIFIAKTRNQVFNLKKEVEKRLNQPLVN